MGVGFFGGTDGIAAGSAAPHILGIYDLSILIVVLAAIIGAVAGIGTKPHDLYPYPVAYSAGAL